MQQGNKVQRVLRRATAPARFRGVLTRRHVDGKETVRTVGRSVKRSGIAMVKILPDLHQRLFDFAQD